ncbi:hypothetical protein WICPIJ_001401 [Wickerhamomyces pijperi]|uniref:VPS9 domain-containing protein n=1 Tax=Wickerhamomyces pijperi TaxID=599730 RepID=A0A9P8TR53_WICPI|nr:hypothetical protein WICPIJ_001401 [Wickerhamomyces pijperi]
MSSHLPLLLNPILNSIFNNPHPEDSPLKDVYSKLSNSTKDNVIILLPPLEILLSYYDTETEMAYSDLAYSEEFISQHILLTNEMKSSSTVKLFKTLNNKEVLVKKDCLFTGRNFKRSLKLNILEYDYFQSYNSYFEKGKKFLVMYVDQPLLGLPRRIRSERLNSTVPIRQRRKSSVVPSSTNSEPISFDKILSESPEISHRLSDSFISLFRSFNVTNISDVQSLSNTFAQNMNLSFQIVKSLPKDLLIGIPRDFKLDESVFNYVERNIYDSVWRKLCELQCDSISQSQYEAMSYMSINQISLSDSLKTDLTQIGHLESRLSLAVDNFKLLEHTTTSKSKLRILRETMSKLTEGITAVTIDADTLISLLMLVIIRARVPLVETHILYIQTFDIDKAENELGITGYTLSTFEAVLYYLKEESTLKSFMGFSAENKRLLDHVANHEYQQIDELHEAFLTEDGSLTSSLRYRAPEGESILSLAISQNDPTLFKQLLQYETLYPLEDILSDTNIHHQTLLVQAVLQNNEEIVRDLIAILLGSCSLQELIEYINAKDSDLRTVGHYISHIHKLISVFGPFINWISKDDNGQTPLFAICRSYDIQNYQEILSLVFKQVQKWYHVQRVQFDYRDHIDDRGNTILHILNSNVKEFLAIFGTCVNVNHFNDKGLTPLMVSVKYNRLQNVKELILCQGIDLHLVDPALFSVIDLCRNPEITNLIEKKVYDTAKSAEQDGSFLSLMKIRYENAEWRLPVLIEHCYKSESCKQVSPVESNHNFQTLKKLFDLLKTRPPQMLGFVPLGYVDSLFDISLNLGNIGNKLKFNRFITEFNIFLGALCLNQGLAEKEIIWDFMRNPLLDLKQQAITPNPTSTDQKIAAHDINYQPEDINEVHIFLKYSLKELRSLKNTFNIMHKLVNFYKLKSEEVLDLHSIVAQVDTSTVPELTFLAQTLLNSDYKGSKISLSKLCTHVLYLSLSTDTLVAKVTAFINDKLFEWWRVYGGLIELIKSYEKYQPYTERHRHPVDESSFTNLTKSMNINGNHLAASLKSKNRSTVGTTGTTTVSTGGTSSFFSSFIESKRTAHLSNLANQITQHFERLALLNLEIKEGREIMALEINNFIIFKGKFIKVFIRDFVRSEIRVGKNRLRALTGGLSDLTRQ